MNFAWIAVLYKRLLEKYWNIYQWGMIMNESSIIREIRNNLNSFDTSKLREVLNFIKYIKYQKELDPTLEILNDSIFYKKVKKGIDEKRTGKVLNWEDVQ